MKAPKAPSPTATASAQSASNRETAITQQLLNQTNQVTPWGNLTYNQTGTATQTGADGKPFSTPTFTSTQTLSPTQQLINEQNEAADIGQNKIALSQIDRIGGHLSTPFSYDTGAHEKWAGDLYGKLNDETNQRNVALMEQKLANQGLQPGTPAYDSAMRNLTYGQEKGRNDFMLGSFGQGLDTALTNRNQPLNEVSSLMSGSQVQQPTFQPTPQAGVSGTDVAGLINQNYQGKLANYQAMMGGLSGIGGAALGGWASGGFKMSDKRLKTDIKKVGEFDSGIDKVKFRYKGSPLQHIGALAQDVQKKKPQAVARTPSGYLAVRYNSQGAPA